MIERWIGWLVIGASALQREPERDALRRLGEELGRLDTYPADATSR